jgi:transposase
MSEETPYKSEGETVEVIDDRADEQAEAGEEYDEKYQDPEWLYNRYHGLEMTMSEMGEKCGVGETTILRWMDEYDIDRRSGAESQTGDGPFANKEWLREQYHEQKKSALEIADECEVVTSTIYSWMDRHGIERRSYSEMQMAEGPHKDEEWLREQYHEKEKSTLEMADECEVGHKTICKWMERHDIERRSRSEASQNYRDKVVYVSDVESEPTESIPERKTVEIGGRRYEGPTTGLNKANSDIQDRDVEVLHSPWRNEEWLREQYHGQEKTKDEIAEVCDVDGNTIHYWMEKHGIERRSLSEANRGDEPYMNEEWLREQYHERGRSAVDMAEECDVSAATIYHWADKHDIDRRSGPETQRGDGPHTDEEYLREQYQECEKSAREIAEECGVSEGTVHNWMDTYDIARRPRGESHIKDGPYTDEEWLREQYHDHEKSGREIAEECEVSGSTILRWMDRHSIERRSLSETTKLQHENGVFDS